MSLSEEMTKRAYALTGLENPNSVSQLKGWLEERGISVDSLGKKDVTSESKSGDKLKMLYEGRWSEGYDSQSDADMAFVSMLCFWCGCVEEQIDRIFRTSGLMRDKWDRRTGDATYGEITIRNSRACVCVCGDLWHRTSGQGVHCTVRS